ncbi:PAS domain S-box protein [Inquilinus sp. KBS0705]|nr:PAS domain S-box protein [Inquilinus sp. KBS0705]
MDTTKDIAVIFLNGTFDFDPFVQISPDLICIAGYDGYFKKINPAVSKTLGYTIEELLSKPINDFVYFEDKDNTIESRETVKRSIPLINFENRYITKSGEIVWLSWTSVGIEEQQLVFGLAKNITHKKRLEEDRNILISNLTKANDELKQLTYATSHNLRAPINNVFSIFHLIKEKKIEDTEIADLLDMLEESTGSLRNTINNYVDSLIQKKSLIIEVGTQSFTESLNTVIKSLKSLIIDTKTVISSDFSEIDVINFNKSYLDSILLNLVSNSIKYAKPNTHPQILLKSKKGNGIVTLIFKDEGLGFDMEKNKDRIFGFNQTFHENEDSKGIGLYLVHNHLTSLGGYIDVVSRINEGTTFTITFKA